MSAEFDLTALEWSPSDGSKGSDLDATPSSMDSVGWDQRTRRIVEQRLGADTVGEAACHDDGVHPTSALWRSSSDRKNGAPIAAVTMPMWS